MTYKQSGLLSTFWHIWHANKSHPLHSTSGGGRDVGGGGSREESRYKTRVESEDEAESECH